MANVFDIDVGGFQAKALIFLADWKNSGPKIQHRRESQIKEGDSGKERRKNSDASMLLTQYYDLLMNEDQAEEMRQLIGEVAEDPDLKIAVPIMADAWKVDDFESNRIYDAEYIINFDEDLGCDVYHKDDTLPSPLQYTLIAPLMFGTFVVEPRVKPVNGKSGKCRLSVVEDSPYTHRIEWVDAGVGGDWPVSLVPDWTSEITEVSKNGIRRTSLGAMREKMTDGHEYAPRYERTGKFLMDRDQMKKLLSFWNEKKGRNKSFDAPLWFDPGLPTEEAPHGYISRFNSENLIFEFRTRSAANCGVQLATLPWEGEGSEEFELDEEVVLFKFTYKSPTPYVWLYTNYEHDIVNSEGTWEKAPFELNDRIISNIKLQIRNFNLSSHRFEGNPLELFMPHGADADMGIEVFTAPYNDLDNMTLQLRGEVDPNSVESEGRSINAECSPLANFLNSPFPNFYVSVKCNWNLFSSQCGVNKADFLREGTISSITDTEIVVAPVPLSGGVLTYSNEDYYGGGYLWIGDGLTYERREILSSSESSGDQYLNIERPLRFHGVGDTVYYLPGCDKTATQCRDKFNNFANCSAFEFFPIEGPTNEPLDGPSGTKK
ncbi:phage BR0599 family protein [Puniceicoccaceae bacterium K14]|nr:phage BR0599 family protein [Puniceicoccaceae bacterium K14]